ncbi:cystathionine beta-synthase [Oligoflexia bacterium]|nr:cystathionine beta-synthase [Oligoflexia bacterium]
MKTGAILQLIGNTPLIELSGFDTGVCRLFVKLECQNPGGSIKDRIGLSMIEAAERDGKLLPGGTIVEATAGNTGLGLALVAAQKNYHVVLVVPDKMSQEKIFHLRALGAEIILTRSDVVKGHPKYYQDLAQKIASETEGAFYVDQFSNTANPLAHETTTGPELWEQMQQKLDAVVCGVGSGGTITGLTKYFKKVAPHVEMVLADPEGSVLVEYIKSGTIGTAGSWLVEGIGEDFIPPLCDLSAVKQAYTVSDKESFKVARELLLKDGILAGSSSGTLIAAALRYCREQKEAKNVATFVCDTGNKYLSKMYNDYWMIDNHFMDRPASGNLCDVIARRHLEGEVITVASDDVLSVAYGRMRLYDISQLPVLDGDKVVGILDESDLLRAVYSDKAAFTEGVGQHMATNLRTVTPETSLEELLKLFDEGLVPIVSDHDKFYGLITPIDLVNFLRGQAA